jgi:hypothetical protein
MKNIITSASLAVLGAASLQAASPLDRAYYAPNPELTSQERSKWWSVSASLRGFYDDNYTTSPKNLKQSSYGVEVAPSVGINIPWERSYLGLNYTYSMRWYEDREDDPVDQTHQASLVLNHSFTETTKLNIKDTFVDSQEPEILEPGVVTAPLRRSKSSNLRNNGDISMDIELSRQFSTSFGYENTLYDYSQDGAGSYSALLDRMEHLGKADIRWHVRPDTIALLGYQFGEVNYKGKDSLISGEPLVAGTNTDPKIRDTQSHYIFAGADHSFTGQLRASARLGAQYTKYTDLPSGSTQDDSSLNPYADASLSYSYAEGSALTLGVRHAKNPTDIAYLSPGIDTTTTLDQETTTVYGVVSHKITSQLTGSLIGQLQHSTFHGGAANDEVDDLYLIGVNLFYNINRFLGAEVGYNFDRLDSDLSQRSFSRNRVYIGLRASY